MVAANPAAPVAADPLGLWSTSWYVCGCKELYIFVLGCLPTIYKVVQSWISVFSLPLLYGMLMHGIC